MKTEAVIIIVSVLILFGTITFLIMAQIIKQFYKTTQIALRELATIRRRNDRLEYEYRVALKSTTDLNNKLLEVKKDAEILANKYNASYKSGYKAGAKAVNDEIKVRKN